MTDHTPLQHFFKQLDLNKRQTLWLQELTDTPISIAYQPSKQATVPNALSCSPIHHEPKDMHTDSQPSGID